MARPDLGPPSCGKIEVRAVPDGMTSRTNAVAMAYLFHKNYVATRRFGGEGGTVAPGVKLPLPAEHIILSQRWAEYSNTELRHSRFRNTAALTRTVKKLLPFGSRRCLDSRLFEV